MSTFDKFLEKLRQSPVPTDITFEEAYNFLTSNKVGFSVRNKGGSHCNFRKEGTLLTIPRKELKAYSIKQILDALEKLGLID